MGRGKSNKVGSSRVENGKVRNSGGSEFENSLKTMTKAQLNSIVNADGSIYTRRDKRLAQNELDSRSATNTSVTWDSDIQDWFNAQMRAARADGASVDTMVSIEANLRDQANRRQRDRSAEQNGTVGSSGTGNYKGVAITQRPSGTYELTSPTNGTRRIFKTLAAARNYIDNAAAMDDNARAMGRSVSRRGTTSGRRRRRG